MKDSKSKQMKEKVRDYQNINSRIVKALLKSYLDRCKFKYVLAFM